jgi:hypothetical protein
MEASTKLVRKQQVVEHRVRRYHSASRARPSVDSDDSGEVPEDERSEEECCHDVIVTTRRAPSRRIHRHRHLSHHEVDSSSSSDSDSDSTKSSPVNNTCNNRKGRVSSEHSNNNNHAINSRGCSSESSGPSSSSSGSSVPQSPSSTNQTDESSSPTACRRRQFPNNKWSPATLKNVLRSLSLNALLLPDSKSTNKNKTNQKILRSPVTYTYVKGLSGLPTQRVPLRQCGGRPCYPPTCLYPPTAELCCLQRAAAIRALCIDR